MKKYLIFIFCIFISFSLFAQETDNIESINEETTSSSNFKFIINEGVSYAQLTRIEKLEDRSNFVRENFLAGAYVNFQTVDFYDLIDFTLQIAAYYPFYNAFNGMQQFPKNKLNYAIDTFFGGTVTYNKLKYIPIDLSLGMHYMYQLTDEYHMSYLGLGFLGSLRFPLTEKFSIVNNYFFSIDDANLGSNAKIQPFEISYQYHIDLGICFSKKTPNSYYYINSKKRAALEAADSN